ncbi:MAG: hypothetical protein ACRD4O_13765 [Bryobacteraceae bacterium]
MAFPSPEVERLLSAHPVSLPLTRAGLRPDAEACGIRSRDPAVLFPAARHGHAALAGLLLRAGCWAESHAVAQDIHSAEGSYWHGIVHRMEPDFSNAGYWFRQAGKHAIFSDLFQRAAEILENQDRKHWGPKHWRLKAAWDPLLFIEWCEEASKGGGEAEAAAIEIQMVEWQLLFDWCLARPASPRS